MNCTLLQKKNLNRPLRVRATNVWVQQQRQQQRRVIRCKGDDNSIFGIRAKSQKDSDEKKNRSKKRKKKKERANAKSLEKEPFKKSFGIKNAELNSAVEKRKKKENKRIRGT